MVSDDVLSSQEIVARYFDMWNSGDSSIAGQILHHDWIDHAHPEVGGPLGVQRAFERIRAAQPELHFRVDAILGDGDLVAVVGAADRAAQEPATRLVWLIGMRDGRMAQMWTYHDMSR